MARSSGLRVKFWGVRGSIACPGPATSRFGGNTSCVEILGANDTIILDAGTGIRELGHTLTARKKPLRVHLLLTHTHWDHIQGFPFFSPIYTPGNEIFVYGPRALEKSLRDAVLFQMQYAYFPVRGVELQARVEFRELDEESFRIDNVEIRTKTMNHPIRVLAYRFSDGKKVGVYTGDNEPYYDVLVDRANRLDTGIHRRSEFVKECNRRVVEFVHGSDLLIADAQYTDEEYRTKRGWGHSSMTTALTLARDAAAKKVVLFHHEPTHTDKDMDAFHHEAVGRARKLDKKLKVVTAKEGSVVAL